MQIVKNMAPYWKSIIVILLLLVVQAFCDLSLPDYTSKLIDTGIQNSGIENPTPKAIEPKAFEVIGAFMDEGDREIWTGSYELRDDGNYYLKNSAEENIEQLDSIVTVPLMMYYYPYNMVAAEEDNEIKAMLNKYGISLDDLPKEQWVMLKNQLQPFIDTMKESMGDKYLASSAISCTKTCYDRIDYDYSDSQMSYLIIAALKMLGMTLIMIVCTILTGFFASRIAAGIGCSLREKVFSKVITFSDAEIGKFSTASLITRTTNDVQQIQVVTVLLLRMVIYAPILAIGGIIKVSETKADMGWIIIVSIAAVFILIGTLLAVTMPKFKKMQTLVDRVNLVAREILTGIPVIRAFGREDKEEERFDEANKDLTKTTLFVNRMMSTMMPTLMFIMYGVGILIEWVASHKIDEGVLQVGAMTAFITYTIMIIMSFLMLSMLSIMLPRATVASKRIQEVIATENSIVDSKDAEDLVNPKGVIEYKNVGFKYSKEDEYVLKNIDFVAKPGEITAIIGSTGCGKSSLIQLIPRFYDVTEGSITIDGKDLRDLTMKSIRSNIGYVPQKAVLFSGDIESNIKFGAPNADETDVKLAAEIAQATEFIDSKEDGFKSSIAQGGANVSGGQKQRLAIARAIARKPRVLIFDDSFSALDFKTDVAVRKALDEHVKDSTVFIVAQRVSTILHADQILVLDEGTLAGKGTHKELMKTCEAYRQIAESQLSEAEIAKSLA